MGENKKGYDMRCLVCSGEFDGRVGAKYCSDKCRQVGHRLSVTEGGLSVTKNELSVTMDEPCVTSVTDDSDRLDLEEMGVNLKKDLGISAWTPNGIMLNKDITIAQVQNIARLIHAKHGRPCPEFRECV